MIIIEIYTKEKGSVMLAPLQSQHPKDTNDNELRDMLIIAYFPEQRKEVFT